MNARTINVTAGVGGDTHNAGLLWGRYIFCRVICEVGKATFSEFRVCSGSAFSEFCFQQKRNCTCWAFVNSWLDCYSLVTHGLIVRAAFQR